MSPCFKGGINLAKTVGLTFDVAEEATGEAEKFKCPHCDKEYAKLEYLKNHITKKHPEV